MCSDGKYSQKHGCVYKANPTKTECNFSVLNSLVFTIVGTALCDTDVNKGDKAVSLHMKTTVVWVTSILSVHSEALCDT